MANGGRNISGLAFVVGGLVVAVGVLAYFVLGDGASNVGDSSTTINVETSGSDSGSGGGSDSGSNGGSVDDSGSASGGQSGN